MLPRRRDGLPICLKKDICVVWAIGGLFSTEFGEHLVFKGGTSLSKAYDVIRRFSEDVDVTNDVRALIPELASDGALPKTNSQVRKWRDAIDKALPTWVSETALPVIERYDVATGVSAKVRAEGTDLYIDYDSLSTGIPEWVMSHHESKLGQFAQVQLVIIVFAPSTPSVV